MFLKDALFDFKKYKRSIAVSGDSWSAAVYIPDEESIGNYTQIPEAFPEQLERRGYIVDNLSQTNSSNTLTIDWLESYLNDHPDVQNVVWVQTDPMREFRIDATAKVFNREVSVVDAQGIVSAVRMHGSIEALIDNLLDNAYSRLHHIAEKHNKKILCIGGCSKLSSIVHNYPNLIPVLPSIVELLIPSVNDTVLYDTDSWLSKQYPQELFKSSDNIELLRDWYTATAKYEAMILPMETCAEFFHPDKWHPNTAGHYLIANFIEEYINKDSL